MVTAGSERPTPHNSCPLMHGNTPECGRGSMVWFTQATMLQTAELPCTTVHKIRRRAQEMVRRGEPVTPLDAACFDTLAAFQDNIFPTMPLAAQ